MSRPHMDPPPGYMSVPQAAEQLGITGASTYRLINTRHLKVSRRDGRIWVAESSVRRRNATLGHLRSGECVSVDEVAEYFGVHRRTVLGWNRAGQLEGQRVSNRLCFTIADVTAFIPSSATGWGRRPAKTPTYTLRGVRYPAPKPPIRERDT
jgi:excisionase family DNA binding protein